MHLITSQEQPLLNCKLKSCRWVPMHLITLQEEPLLIGQVFILRQWVIVKIMLVPYLRC